MWRGPCVCLFFCFVCLFFCSVFEFFLGPSSSCWSLFLKLQIFIFGCATSPIFSYGLFLRDADKWQPLHFFPGTCGHWSGETSQETWAQKVGWKVSVFLVSLHVFFGLLQNDLPKMGGKIWIFVFIKKNGEEGKKQIILCFKNLGWHEPWNPGWLMKGSLFYGLWSKPYMCWGPNSRCFHRIGDGHQPNK